MDQMTTDLQLPGFRFHPTEEELLDFYLKNKVFGKKLRCDVIGFLNIYHHDPWELPGLSKIGEREWYFIVPRDRKHGSSGRPNRTTQNGFWKATGSDRKIVSLSEPKRVMGLRKTLVFYKGRAPRGTKTDWVMNEYRLPDTCSLPKDIVLCKIYRKATSLKVLEQRAAMEERMSSSPSLSSSSMDNHQQEGMVFKKEIEQVTVYDEDGDEKTAKEISIKRALQLPSGLTELQVPKLMNMDWTQDTFWTQFNSPWLQNFTPYANILNF